MKKGFKKLSVLLSIIMVLTVFAPYAAVADDSATSPAAVVTTVDAGTPSDPEATGDTTTTDGAGDTTTGETTTTDGAGDTTTGETTTTDGAIDATLPIEEENNISGAAVRMMTLQSRPSTYTLSATVNADGRGTITKNPDDTEYSKNSVVTVAVATVSEGFKFVGWDFDQEEYAHQDVYDVKEGNKITVKMIGNNSSKTVKAIFEPTTYSLSSSVTTAANGENMGTVTPANGTYNNGDTVTLKAKSADREGYKFIHWEYTPEKYWDKKDVYDTDGDEIEIKMRGENTAKYVKAIFKQVKYSIDAYVAREDANGNLVPAPEMGEVSPIRGEWYQDKIWLWDKETITASAKPGYEFVRWDHEAETFDYWFIKKITDNVYNADNANKRITVTMKGDNMAKKVTAVFKAAKFNLTTSTSPAEIGSVTPSGTNQYDYNSTVNLTAAVPEGYNFSKWSGDAYGTTTSASITMLARDMTAIAEYTPRTYTVRAQIKGGTGGQLNSADDKTIRHGTTINLDILFVPQPAAGYQFVRWDVEGLDSDGKSLVVTKDVTAVAVFSKNVYLLTIEQSTGGRVDNQDPASGSDNKYEHGAYVTLEAVPDQYYTFAGWTGNVPDVDKNKASIKLYMDGNKTVAATFAKAEYNVAATASPGAFAGTVAGNGSYTAQTNATLTATAKQGWSFEGWYKGSEKVSGSSAYTFEVLAATSLAANFTPLPGNDEDFTSGKAIIRDFRIDHPDFQRIVDGKIVTGLVDSSLNNEGNPIFAGTPGGTIESADTFDQWYKNVPGVNYGILYNISLNDQGDGYFGISNLSNFFPIDGQGFGNEGNNHNFHFTLEYEREFVYDPAKTIIKVQSDDDLWIFINGELAVDAGGVHGISETTVDIKSLMEKQGKKLGDVNTFKLFFAERNTVQSALGFKANFFAPAGTIIVNKNVVRDVGPNYDEMGAISVSEEPNNNYDIVDNTEFTVTISGGPEGFQSRTMTVSESTPAAFRALPIGTYTITEAANDSYERIDKDFSVGVVENGQEEQVNIINNLITYKLNSTSDSNGIISPDVDGAAFNKGTVVEFIFAANAGYMFDKWQAGIGFDVPVLNTETDKYEIVMDANKNVKALFKLIPSTPEAPSAPGSAVSTNSGSYTLLTAVAGQGTILPGPGSTSYTKGTKVQLTAAPAAGWKLSGWQGDAVDASNQIYMDGNKSITAVFTQIVEVIANEPVAQDAAATTETVTEPQVEEIVEEEAPAAPARLPDTGGVPAGIFYGLGGFITAGGVILRRKMK